MDIIYSGQIASTLSPAGAYAIGQYFKNNDALNRQDGGNRAGEGSQSHLLAHGLLAAATSYATGQSVETITASSITTMGAEKLAPALGKLLYGTEQAADLTAEQKQTISNVLGTAGLVAGVVTAQATGADSISSVSAGQQVQGSVQNAVENNKSVSRTIDDSAEGCNQFTCAIYAVGKAIYEVGTFGVGSRHDEWRDKYDNGEITYEEYLRIGIAGGGAIAIAEAYGGKFVIKIGGKVMGQFASKSDAEKALAEAKRVSKKDTPNGYEPDNNLLSSELIRLQNSIDKKIAQSQRKHILGDSQHKHGSYFKSERDVSMQPIPAAEKSFPLQRTIILLKELKK